MNEHPFSHLLVLVQCDQKINSLKKNSEHLEQEIAEITAEKEQLERDLKAAHDKVFTSKKNVDAQELEMKTLDQHEQHKKTIFANISDYKQYQSLKVEIDEVQKKQLEQEVAVLDAWSQLESAQAALEKKQRDSVEQEQKLEATQEEKKNQLSQVLAEIDSLRAQRPEKEIAVPAEWLEKYNIIHARVSDPVVAVVNKVCSACSQVIIPSDLARINHGALVQCKGCFRLVYSPEVMDARS